MRDPERRSAYACDVSITDRSERIALVALLQARPGKLGWPEIMAEVIEAGSAVEVWQRLAPAALFDRPGEDDPLAAAEHCIVDWATHDVRLLTVLDNDYPFRLRGIHQAPPILFSRGEVIEDDIAVSVVGSRKASQRGLDIAASVARALAREDVTVVAGLALGIDTIAHRTTLDEGKRTVAVIGTGINKYYPATNRDLQDLISNKGLLLSQFWPDAPPQRHTFLMRNATMSGYGVATVVVEAGEQSGARAQARMAVEHGRPVILTDLVVENNEWPDKLIGRPGVHVASSTREVMDIVRSLTQKRADVEDEVQRLVSAQT